MSENPLRDATRYPQGGVVQKIASYILHAREKPVRTESRDSALKCILD